MDEIPTLFALLVTPIQIPDRHGGIEVVVQALREGLAARRHRPVIVAGSLEQPTDYYHQEPDVIRVRGTRTGDLPQYAVAQRDAFRAIDRSLSSATADPVVHCQDYFYFPACAEACARHDVPLVATLHFSKAHELANGGNVNSYARMTESIQRRVYEESDSVIFVSQALADVFQNHYGQRSGDSRSIHNPICCEPPPLEERSIDGIPIVLAAGRLVPEKNFADLVAAAAILKSRGIPIEVEIAGEGRVRHELERQAVERGVSDRVRFLGLLPRTALLRRYREADMVAITSAFEPFGLVCVEAMAMGALVIAYKGSGGPEEIIRDGLTGSLCEASPMALSEAIAENLSRRTLAQSMRLAAREQVMQRFTNETFILAHERLYRSVAQPTVVGANHVYKG